MKKNCICANLKFEKRGYNQHFREDCVECVVN